MNGGRFRDLLSKPSSIWQDGTAMNEIRTRLHIAADGTITGRAPRGVPPGDHDAAIIVEALYPPRPLPPDAATRVRVIQDRLARLPVLDQRTPDEIIGYGEDGLAH